MKNIFTPGNLVISILSGLIVEVITSGSHNSFSGKVIDYDKSKLCDTIPMFTIGTIEHIWRKDVFVQYKPKLTKLKIL